MSEPVGPQKENLGIKALRIVGWIVGAGIGKYSGIKFLIPLFTTGVAWYVGRKLMAENKKLVLPAFSVQAGHFLWLGFGIVYIGVLNANIIDLVLFAVGLLWLLKKPSPGPLYFLGVYQLLMLFKVGISFASKHPIFRVTQYVVC